jgi:hypothetical protein
MSRNDLVTNALVRAGDVGEFTTTGVACAVPTCRLQDFLPFTCEGCKKPHCLAHCRPDSHGCPHSSLVDHQVFVCPLCKLGVSIVPGEDLNATFQRHEATPSCRGGRGDKKKKRCALNGCREPLGVTGGFRCKVCAGDFCVAHRLDLAHSCSGPPKKPGFFARAVGGGGGGSNGSSGSSGAKQHTANPAAPPKLPSIKAPVVPTADDVRATADRRKREPTSPGASPHTPCSMV